jgi:hypothetical protein
MPDKRARDDFTPDMKTQLTKRETQHETIRWMMNHVGTILSGSVLGIEESDAIMRLLLNIVLRTNDRQVHDDALYVICLLALTLDADIGECSQSVVIRLIESLRDFHLATIERINSIAFLGVFGRVDRFTMREASTVLRELTMVADEVRLAVLQSLTLLVSAGRVMPGECDLLTLAVESAAWPTKALSDAGREGVAVARELGVAGGDGLLDGVSNGEGVVWRVPKARYKLRPHVEWPSEWADIQCPPWLPGEGQLIILRTAKDWVILSALRRQFRGDFSEVLLRANWAPAVLGFECLRQLEEECSVPRRFHGGFRGPELQERKAMVRKRDREMDQARRLKAAGWE